MTAITGYIQNLVGAYYPDFTMTAQPTSSYYQSLTGGGSALIPFGKTYFPSASGYLQMNLPETETNGQLIAFASRYTADGVYQQMFFEPVIIPDVPSIDFSDLLVVIQPEEPFFLPSNPSGGGGIIAGVSSISTPGGQPTAGNLNFLGGTNVTITQQGKNITFSAQGGGVGSNVNIFDSDGNDITSTDGKLDVNEIVPWANFGQTTPKQVEVTDVSTLLLAANPFRLYASFANNDAVAKMVYLQYQNPAAWRHGKTLAYNAERDITLIELFTGQVNAIAETGTTVMIDVIEGVE